MACLQQMLFKMQQIQALQACGLICDRCEESMRAEALKRGVRQLNSDSDSDLDNAEATDLEAAGLRPELAEYRVEVTGARVALSGAKSLLYHYCSKLPTDM